MSKHTPGPWKADGLHIVGADHTIVAYKINKPSGDLSGVAYADARLIAAAPDLLAALKSIREARDRHADEGWLPDGYDALDDYAADVADRAIAKAEGR